MRLPPWVCITFMLTVLAYNHAGIRAYEKAGFREFGRRREVRWMDGKVWDVVYHGLLVQRVQEPAARSHLRARRVLILTNKLYFMTAVTTAPL